MRWSSTGLWQLKNITCITIKAPWFYHIAFFCSDMADHKSAVWYLSSKLNPFIQALSSKCNRGPLSASLYQYCKWVVNSNTCMACGSSFITYGFRFEQIFCFLEYLVKISTSHICCTCHTWKAAYAFTQCRYAVLMGCMICTTVQCICLSSH
jgi:hypothetical protein